MSAPTAEVISAGVKQYVREPVNIALLLIIPPLLIVAMSGAISTFSDVIGGNLGERAGAGLAGLWAAAILTGVASFYLSLASSRVDGRLVLAGLRPVSVAAAHVSATISIAVISTAVSVAMLLVTQTVGDAVEVFAAILAAALIYGALGALISVFLRGDLEGSFVIILLFMLDAFVGGPLASGKGIFADSLPVHFPSEIVVAAMVDGPVRDSWVLWSGAYLAVLGVLSWVVLVRRRAVS